MHTVDVWSQHVNERFMAEPLLETVIRWARITPAAPTLEETLAAMDAGGVEIALLAAWHGPQGMLISNDEVMEAVKANPDRFRGLASVDLARPMDAVREVRRRVAEGFVGVRVVPWLWSLPPNDRRYYPVYAACVDAGVPLCTQIGHTGPLRPSEVGRPIPYLDEVMLDFPELVLVGGHVGFPWVSEVLSLAMKFPNFYIDTSAYVMHRVPTELVSYLAGQGRRRVMFGTNWPMLSATRALERIDEFGLDDEARELFLSGNARRVFRLG